MTLNPFEQAVEEKIERAAERIKHGQQVDGWAFQPDRICLEAADEPVDVAGWLRGLDLHPKPDGADELITMITGDAALLWEAIGRLRDMYQ